MNLIITLCRLNSFVDNLTVGTTTTAAVLTMIARPSSFLIFRCRIRTTTAHVFWGSPFNTRYCDIALGTVNSWATFYNGTFLYIFVFATNIRSKYETRFVRFSKPSQSLSIISWFRRAIKPSSKYLLFNTIGISTVGRHRYIIENADRTSMWLYLLYSIQ